MRNAVVKLTGGKLNRRHLAAPPGRDTRPTTNFMREALFNLLGHDWQGRSLLDLFAGSGAVGIEAWSRGCTAVTLVEQNRAALRALQGNLTSLGITTGVTVVGLPVARAILRLAAAGRQFSHIFLDPPYDETILATTLQALSGSSLDSPQGVIVAQHSVDVRVSERIGSLVVEDWRKYGKSAFTFLSREER